ncbi:MAG: hypothetical protein M5U17_03550 [Ignavibacterium sp.]|nr:hypothetical protein [Ignavibacterium sp.]
MKKHELFYSLDISDIQEIADQDLERELTEAELKKVIDTVPKYIKWDEAISYAFMELRLPTKDELIEKRRKKSKKV